MSKGPRPAFASLARTAIERQVAEVRVIDAVWHLGINHVWVRWPIASDGWCFIGIQRHLDWITAEYGEANEPCDLSALSLLPGSEDPNSPGWRVRLGDLIEGEDRWWRPGADQVHLVERLEWMALQLRVKGHAYGVHHRPLER